MKKKNKNCTTLDEIIEKKYGKKGTQKREQWEQEFEAFRLGVMLEEARKKMNMTQTIIYSILLFYFTGSLSSQILSSKQEDAVRKTISKQFGTAGEQTLLNLGAASFCNVGGDTLYNPAGYNYLFRLKSDSLERLDHSSFHGNNGRRFLFSWKNKLYAVGGYGFFTTNNNLIYFNNETKEWCYAPTHGEIPPSILGIAFKSGNRVYSFNNYKSGNNAEPDIEDPYSYCLDLDSWTWERFEPLQQITRLKGEAYYAKEYVFFHGLNTSLIILSSEKKFVLIKNDEYGLSLNSHLNSIDGNNLFFIKHDNNGTPLQLKIDLSRIWQQNFKEIKSFEFKKPETKTTGFFPWPVMLASIAGVLICLFTFLKFRKQEKSFELIENKEEAVPTELKIADEHLLEEELGQSELLTIILNAPKLLLTIDELDEILKISHLEPDSRKLRRHRLINEVQKEHPELITRVKDNSDRRRYLYKITKNSTQVK